MSTRAAIIIRDEHTTLQFYRHSDGYPEGAGADLINFVDGYRRGAMRLDAMQSSGWLVVRGYFNSHGVQPADQVGTRLTGVPDESDRMYGWKVGSYEPMDDRIPSDVEYIYIIDLQAKTLSCREPKRGFWDNPTLENTTACKAFKTVSFKGGSRE